METNEMMHQETTVKHNYFPDPDFLQIADAKLYTEDTDEFPVHKILLAKTSPYFYHLFCGDEAKEKTSFLVPGVKGEELENILSYIYAGTIHITDANVQKLIRAADLLSFDNLLTYIETVYMRDNLSLNNCLAIFLAGLEINRESITCQTFRFMQTRFETAVSTNESEFVKMPLKALKRFLGDKNLRVTDENVVWMSIKKWVQADIASRQHIVPELLTCIVISDGDEKLAENVLQSELVAHNPFCGEINNLKQASLCNCDIFRNCIRSRQDPEQALFDRRQPDHFYFFVHCRDRTMMESKYSIFVTYDESIDFWREIFEVTFKPEYLVCIGHSIYIFSDSMDDETQPASGIRRYNVVGKVWGAMQQFTAHMDAEVFSVVHLEGLIYVLGGESCETENLILDVEVYDPEEDTWSNVPPMSPIYACRAATLGKRIYAIGQSGPSDSDQIPLIMQVYDPESKVWTVAKGPSVRRFDYCLIAHRERLYLIGGQDGDQYLASVEFYDPAKDEWTSLKDLPYTFCSPRAIILQDELIIYESDTRYCSNFSETNSAVQWNEKLQAWKVLENSSPLSNLHKYNTFINDNRGRPNGTVMENRDPKTIFFRSPFN